MVNAGRGIVFLVPLRKKFFPLYEGMRIFKGAERVTIISAKANRIDYTFDSDDKNVFTSHAFIDFFIPAVLLLRETGDERYQELYYKDWDIVEKNIKRKNSNNFFQPGIKFGFQTKLYKDAEKGICIRFHSSKTIVVPPTTSVDEWED